MKKILLFGAGKSATVLIRFLIGQAESNHWQLVVADANEALVLQKTKNHPATLAVGMDIKDDVLRSSLIADADVVISMMPPALHILIAKDCIRLSKSLLTASYVDDAIKALEPDIKKKGLLFLCEMGLDPGIDHMSAMKLFDEIHAKGGQITSFKSHCGGLVAPESDDNPWHYKISWNPRNVVLAGKAGAIYKENGKEMHVPYDQLFAQQNLVRIDGASPLELSYYPNRNSLGYIDIYGLHHCDTFIRTTLRYPQFMSGWNGIIQLGLTDENPHYASDGKTLHHFFQHQINTHNINFSENFKCQLEWLGWNDNLTLINKGCCSPADVLQMCLEQKLALKHGDKDMIVMLHEIEYLQEGKKHAVNSSLVVIGEDESHTAMAQTVGLPLGIAACMLLKNEMTLSGLHIPIIKEIYEPVLGVLSQQGIVFAEKFS